MIPERDFQATVIEYARACGWKVAHFHDSRRQVGGKFVGDSDAAGFPDLVMVRDKAILFVELKSEKGRLSSAQLGWCQVLLGAAETCIWRPRHWPEIERRLR